MRDGGVLMHYKTWHNICTVCILCGQVHIATEVMLMSVVTMDIRTIRHTTLMGYDGNDMCCWCLWSK